MVEVTLIFPTQGVCLEACKVMVNHGIWNLLGLEAIKYFLPNTRVWRMSEGDITIIFIIDSYIKHQAKEIKTDMQLQAHYDVEIKRDRCSLLSRKSTPTEWKNRNSNENVTSRENTRKTPAKMFVPLWQGWWHFKARGM